MLYTRFKRLELVDPVSQDEIEQLAYETRTDPKNTFEYSSYPSYLPEELRTETTGVVYDDLDEVGKDSHCQAQFFPENGGKIHMFATTGLNHDNYVKARAYGAYRLIVPAFREFNPGHVSLMSLHHHNAMTKEQRDAHNVSVWFACELLAPRRDVATYLKSIRDKKSGDELLASMVYRYRIPANIATLILKKPYRHSLRRERNT